jgi:hypothetical protein
VSKQKKKRSNKHNPDYDAVAEIDDPEDAEGSGRGKNAVQQDDAERSGAAQFVPVKLDA